MKLRITMLLQSPSGWELFWIAILIETDIARAINHAHAFPGARNLRSLVPSEVSAIFERFRTKSTCEMCKF